jgi:MbtH protein
MSSEVRPEPARYDVVVNDEEQYSIWESGRALPRGWRTVDVSGTRDECLDYIEQVWTDIRPLSLRRQLEHRPNDEGT